MKRKWVIPDIHGCVKTVQALLSEQIKPTKFDEIYFLGDYIDRGPDSKGVIDLLMKLQREQYNVVALIGNHEEFLVELYDMETTPGKFSFFNSAKKKREIFFEIGGRRTLKSFHVNHAKEIPEEYINWMRNLTYYAEVDDFILVHAGLNFRPDDPLTDKKSMLWIRDYEIMPEKINNRRIIHGHVPVNFELIDLAIKNKSYKFIDLDNGPYMSSRDGFGNMIALELTSMQYVVQFNLDL